MGQILRRSSGLLLVALASLLGPLAALGAETAYVLRGVSLIDGTGGPAQRDVDLALEGGKIASISPAGAAKAPPGAKEIDYRGKFVVPGLISVHSHLGQTNGVRRGPQNFTRENIGRQLRQYEAYGVTTVVSLGTNLPLIYRLRDEWRAQGKWPGADFLVADRGIGAVGGAPGNMQLNGVDQIDRPQNADEAREAVRSAKARGTDCIKLWVDSRGMSPTVTKEVYTAVIDEAHRSGLKAFAHIFTLDDAKGLVDAGVDVIAHGVRDQPVDQAFIDAMKAKSVWYVPTIALDEAFYIYADRPAWIESPLFRNSAQADLLKQIEDPAWREKTLAEPAVKAARESVRMNQRNVAVLHKVGVKVGFGTDSGAFPLRIPGFAEHRELELLTEAGLSPGEVLSIATAQSAELLGLKDRGVLQAGKRADLIVLDGDPTDDIRQLHRIHAVWRGGERVGGPITDFTP